MFGPLKLRQGPGSDWSKGLCFMEAVAWMDGNLEPTDKPACACPVLSNFAISINDYISDDRRNDLLRMVLPMIGTRAPHCEKLRQDTIILFTVRNVLIPLLELTKSPFAGMLKGESCPDRIKHFLKKEADRYGADCHPRFRWLESILHQRFGFTSALVSACADLRDQAIQEMKVIHEPEMPIEDFIPLSDVPSEIPLLRMKTVTTGHKATEIFSLLVGILDVAVQIGPSGQRDLYNDTMRNREARLTEHAKELQNA